MWRTMNFLFNKKEALKLKDGPHRRLSHLISPLPYFSFHEVICYIAQVTIAEVYHIYWIVGPPKAKRTLFDKRSWYSNFNEPPERMRRRSCLPTGTELCGLVQNLDGTTWAVRTCLLHLLYHIKSMRKLPVFYSTQIWKDNKIVLFNLTTHWRKDVIWCVSPFNSASLFLFFAVFKWTWPFSLFLCLSWQSGQGKRVR